MDKNKQIICGFCGRNENEVEDLIASGDGKLYICCHCVDRAHTTMHECRKEDKDSAEATEKGIKLISPMEIKKKLDEYIVGQHDAKKVLSVAVYNHYKRVQNNSPNYPDVVLEKSNILMLGPTGSGKTLLAKTLATVLNVPFAIADATALTEAGYVGEDVENILLKLISNANGDIKRAEHGIIYIDEIDKICRKTANVSITRDVSGEGVQQALLKIIESTVANVPPTGGRKHPHQEFTKIDTTNILFICGGAFVGLEKIVGKRKDGNSIGFSSNLKTNKEENYAELVQDLQPDDLIEFGLIPEFVGRLPVVATLNHLGEDALEQILVEPKNALVSQYKKLMDMDGIALEFEDAAIKAIAKRAIQLKTGARGLRTIIENAVLGLMYDAPADPSIDKIIITSNTIENKEKPIILKRTA